MFYRLNEVIKIVSLSKATIYRLIKEGLFPEQVQISRRRVGWRKSEIDEFTKSPNITRGA